MGKVTKSLTLLSVYLFLYVPLFILIAYSFNESKYQTSWKGFTFEWYIKLASNSALIQAALNSLLVAVVSASAATVLGTMGAVTFHRYPFRGKKLLYGLTYSVILMPEIVIGISLLVLFILIGADPGFWPLLLSHITFCLPFVIVTVLSRLKGFDPQIIEASRDLGASDFQTFRHVLLPMMFPACMVGWLLRFTLSMDDVIISFFMTGPKFDILPLRVYSMVRLGVKPEVNALCAIMFCSLLVVVLLTQHLLKEKKR